MAWYSPELKKSGQNPSNNEQNAVYFNIDGNDIELVARILFYDDYAQKFIENGVELNKTYEGVILEGLRLWSGKFTGAYSKEENVHYDFIEGMKINVTFTAEVYHEEDLFSDNRYVHIYVENDEYTGGKWYDGCYGIPHTATRGGLIRTVTGFPTILTDTTVKQWMCGTGMYRRFV